MKLHFAGPIKVKYSDGSKDGNIDEPISKNGNHDNSTVVLLKN